MGYTLDQLNQMAEGTQLNEIKFKLKSCAKHKDEPGEHGPMYWQPAKGFLADTNEEIDFVFKIPKDISPLVGKMVTIRAKNSERGMSGIKVGAYKDKTQLIITPSAEIESSGGGRGAPAPTQAPAGRGRGQAVPPAGRGRPAPTSGGGDKPTTTLQDWVDLMVWIRGKMPWAEGDTPESHQGACSTIYISAERNGLRAPKLDPEQRQEPEPEREPERAQDQPSSEDDNIPF